MFKVTNFSGKAPKIAPRLLQDSQAQIASNCLLENGQLRAWRASNDTGANTPVGTVTIYKLTSSIWLTFNTDVNVIRSPISEDAYDRLYWTGATYPRYGSYANITSGGGPYPGVSYRLGLPRPSKPTAAISGTADPDTDPTSYAYTVTFVSQYGEESPPALIENADIIQWYPGQTRTVTLPGQPTGSYALSGAKWRLYRTNENGEFQFMVELPFGTTTYVDAIAAENLGEVLPSQDWDAPPDDNAADHPEGQMKGLVAMANGIFAGFTGKTVCFSEAFQPHAWPKEYQLTTMWDIVAICPTSDGLVVATEGKPYMVQGTDSASMTMMEIDSSQACVSKRSMVDMGEFCVYASPDGLVSAGPGGVELITQDLFTRQQWQALNPSSIHAYQWNGKYVMFYSNGVTSAGMVLDPDNENAVLTDIGFYANAGFTDLLSDKLYLLVGTDIYEFDAGSALTYVWKSKQFYNVRPYCPAAAKVDAETYPVTFRLYADETLKHTEVVASTNPFRLPAGYMARQFEFELEGTSDVNMVVVSPSMSDIDSV